MNEINPVFSQFTPPKVNSSVDIAEKDKDKNKNTKDYVKKYALPALAALAVVGIGAMVFIKRKDISAAFAGSKNQPIPNKQGDNCLGGIDTQKAEHVIQQEEPVLDPWKARKAAEELWKNNSSRTSVYVDDMDFSEILSRDRGTKYKAQSDDVAQELRLWFEKRVNDDIPVVEKYGKASNIIFDKYEILPHTYIDDTDVFISAKCSMYQLHDWEECAFLTGSKDTFSSTTELVKRIRDWAAHMLDGRHKADSTDTKRLSLIAASDNTGRKFVRFNMPLPHIKGLPCDSRGSFEEVVLLSKDNNFTQLQKDIIKIFSDSANRDSILEAPFCMSYDAVAKGRDGILHNKTAFLSIIQSWANHSKEIDVNSLIEKSNGILEIG